MPIYILRLFRERECVCVCVCVCVYVCALAVEDSHLTYIVAPDELK